MDELIWLVTYLFFISVAAERFTDILKRLVLEKFVTNGVVYQLTSGLFGGAMAYLSPPEGLMESMPSVVLFIVVGLCVSGGSSLWNTILSTLTELSKNLKSLKKNE